MKILLEKKLVIKESYKFLSLYEIVYSSEKNLAEKLFEKIKLSIKTMDLKILQLYIVYQIVQKLV